MRLGLKERFLAGEMPALADCRARLAADTAILSGDYLAMLPGYDLVPRNLLSRRKA